MKPKYSEIIFNHLLFSFNPYVFTIPGAIIVDDMGIELTILCFSVVWFYKSND